MDNSTPNYIFFLFVIVVGVLFYIIASWILDIRTTATTTTEPFTEGFANTNPQYTYLPNSSSPNLSIKFGLSDLAMDISGVCDFIKVDSALNSLKNIAATTASATTASATTASATTASATTASATTASATTASATTASATTASATTASATTASATTASATTASATTASATTASATTTPSAQPTQTTMTPSPYSGNTNATTANKIETFTTGPETTTVPISTTPAITVSGNTTATSLSVDLNQDTKERDTKEPDVTPTQPPITTTEPTSAITEPSTNGEYTVPYTELSIYKIYNSATGSYNNENIFKLMDISYGDLFDTSKIGNLSDANIARMWDANVSISIDDTLYNGANYFVIQSNKNNRQCASAGKEWPGLSSYFLRQIQKNKLRSAVLLSLKNAYYSVIKPRFLMNMLSNIYWQNAQSFTNTDKGTQNSVIFVLNTCANMVKTNTLAADLSANDVAKIIAEDTPFTFDALWLYQMTSIAFELHRFAAYFQTNGSITSGNKTPAITTTLDKFISGYPQYLQKINQVEPNSPLVFLLRYLPSNADCPIVSKLTPYANNIQF